MTIPVIPGPFSFLTGAGEALGAIGKGRSERNVYEQQQAQQNAQILTTLIARGLIAPEALAAHATSELFHRAGLPGIDPSQVELSPELLKARTARQEVGNIQSGTTAAQLYGGTPTTADVSGVGAKTAENQATSLALQGISKPQAQVKAGVVSATAAPLIQQAQAAGARQQTTEAEGLNQIWQSVKERLPKDADFSKVADYAAVHGLGFLTSLNDMYARLGAERTSEHTAQVRLLTTVHSNASREYQQATAIWAKSLQDEIDRQLDPIGPAGRMSEEEKNVIRNNIVKQYQGSKPKMETFLKDAIDAYGADEGEYSAAVRGVAGGISNQGAVGKAKPQGNPYDTMKAERKGGNPELTDEKIDAATSLSPEQKAELKKIPFPKKSKKPGGGAGF